MPAKAKVQSAASQGGKNDWIISCDYFSDSNNKTIIIFRPIHVLISYAG
jgi:hypothetical protein